MAHFRRRWCPTPRPWRPWSSAWPTSVPAARASWSGCWSIRRSTPPAPAPSRTTCCSPCAFPSMSRAAAGNTPITAPASAWSTPCSTCARRRQDVRRFVSDLEEWTIRTLARFSVRGRAPRRPGRRLGGRPESRRARRQPARGQDRRHRRAHPPLGVVPRHVDQRRARPVALRGHRALRHRRAWRDLAGRSRPAGHPGRSRHGAGGDVRRGVRRGASDRRQLREALRQHIEIDRLDVDLLDPGQRGPRRQASIIAPTAARRPTISASTAPSGRLRTQPAGRGAGRSRSPSRDSRRPAPGR